MNVKRLTEDYFKRFNAYYAQFEINAAERKEKGLCIAECPNYLEEVVRPVLETLPTLLPEYGFTAPPPDYVMYGQYYRIKTGQILVGGFTVGEAFELYFTPLFHGQPCGKTVVISDTEQLVQLISESLTHRIVQPLKR